MEAAAHATVAFLSPTWLAGVAGTAAVSAWVLWLGRGATAARLRVVSFGLAAVSVAQWTLEQAYVIPAGRWTAAENLPLHLCGLSGLLAVILMLRPAQGLFELVYYWGLAGAFHALMTPELTLGDTPFLRVNFYVGHGLILVIALWATFGLGYRPRRGSWWRIFLWTQLLLPAVALVNLALDANYMFLMRPPVADNPLVVGPPPWHLLGYEIAAIAHFVLLYLPFRNATGTTPRATPSSDQWPPLGARE